LPILNLEIGFISNNLLQSCIWGKIIMNKNILAIGIIILLFIISTLTPIGIGYKIVNINGGLKDDIDLEEPLQPNDSGFLDLMGMGPKDTPWPMKCHDNHHTGRSPYSTAHIDGTEKWRFPLHNRVLNDPIIDSDGTIYVMGEYEGLNYYLFAINPDGTEKWKIRLGGPIIGSTAAIGEDGTIYIGDWDDFLNAINPDGTLKWKFDADDNIDSSPAIADDGTIYFGTMGFEISGGCNIFAVNPDGTEKWRYHTGDVITSDPAIGDDGTIYIGSMDNFLYAMYPNGDLRWRFETGSYVKGSASIADDGTIYVGSFDDYLYAINPDGTLKWRTVVDTGLEANPSIASDGTIYAAHGNLYAVNPEDGSKKWTFDFGEGKHVHKSCPTISADGTIYVGLIVDEVSGNPDGGEILAVDSNGVEKWRKRISNYECQSTPAIASDGTVYIGSDSVSPDAGSYGYLHAFGPVDSNAPPDTPTITGTTNGNAGEEYPYYFVTHDPDNNPVSFYIEWGDETSTGWTREYASDEQARVKHTYNARGEYTIKAKARDTLGEESDWATLSISMPRNKPYINTPFLNFLESHPILYQLLLRFLRL